MQAAKFTISLLALGIFSLNFAYEVRGRSLPAHAKYAGALFSFFSFVVLAPDIIDAIPRWLNYLPHGGQDVVRHIAHLYRSVVSGTDISTMPDLEARMATLLLSLLIFFAIFIVSVCSFEMFEMWEAGGWYMPSEMPSKDTLGLVFLLLTGGCIVLGIPLSWTTHLGYQNWVVKLGHFMAFWGTICAGLLLFSFSFLSSSELIGTRHYAAAAAAFVFWFIAGAIVIVAGVHFGLGIAV